MKIIAYTFEADAHCVECAKKRFEAGKKLLGIDKYSNAKLDENGIALDCEDVEGNLVHPIFSNDQEFIGSSCGTCGKEIKP